MAHTLNANYTANINIMRINLGRGMTPAQANDVINSFKVQFIANNLYDDQAQQFINTMRALVVEHGTGIKVCLLYTSPSPRD